MFLAETCVACHEIHEFDVRIPLSHAFECWHRCAFCLHFHFCTFHTDCWGNHWASGSEILVQHRPTCMRPFYLAWLGSCCLVQETTIHHSASWPIQVAAVSDLWVGLCCWPEPVLDDLFSDDFLLGTRTYTLWPCQRSSDLLSISLYVAWSSLMHSKPHQQYYDWIEAVFLNHVELTVAIDQLNIIVLLLLILDLLCSGLCYLFLVDHEGLWQSFGQLSPFNILFHTFFLMFC